MSFRILPSRETEQDRLDRWDRMAAAWRHIDPQFAEFLELFVRAPRYRQIEITALIYYHATLARLRKGWAVLRSP